MYHTSKAVSNSIFTYFSFEFNFFFSPGARALISIHFSYTCACSVVEYDMYLFSSWNESGSNIVRISFWHWCNSIQYGFVSNKCVTIFLFICVFVCAPECTEVMYILCRKKVHAHLIKDNQTDYLRFNICFGSANFNWHSVYLWPFILNVLSLWEAKAKWKHQLNRIFYSRWSPRMCVLNSVLKF